MADAAPMGRRTVRSRLISVGLLLVAGSVVNVVVAIACSLWGSARGWGVVTMAQGGTAIGSPSRGDSLFRLDRVPDEWTKTSPHAGYSLMAIRRASGFGVEQTRIDVINSAWSETSRCGRVFVIECGWPFVALGAEALKEGTVSLGNPPQAPEFPFSLELDTGVEVTWHWAFMAPEFVDPDGTGYGWGDPLPRVVPLRVLPVGFALGTVFWSGVIAGPGALFRLARRRRRQRRGVCAGCGYEVGELASCPECGVRRHSTRPRTRARPRSTFRCGAPPPLVSMSTGHSLNSSGHASQR